MDDPINPNYYIGRVECIDAIETAVQDLSGVEAALTAQVIKYMWRWRRKNGVQDLRKANWYLQRLIDKQEEEG